MERRKMSMELKTRGVTVQFRSKLPQQHFYFWSVLLPFSFFPTKRHLFGLMGCTQSNNRKKQPLIVHKLSKSVRENCNNKEGKPDNTPKDNYNWTTKCTDVTLNFDYTGSLQRPLYMNIEGRGIYKGTIRVR